MSNPNKLLEMTVFVTAVDSNSFVGAAKKLNMSKQSISRNMNSLEERLQIKLLQRTTRKMMLTYEGQTFYLQAKSILNALDEAENSLYSDKLNASGLLKINVPVSFGIIKLSPLWQVFMDRYPKIKLDITLSDRRVNLMEEGYDLAVRIGHLGDSSLIGRKLMTAKILASASPEYIRKKGFPFHPHELKQHKIILYSHGSQRKQWEFWRDKQSYQVQPTVSVFCNNGDTCRTLMLQGGGISIQPDFIVENDIKQGNLVEVLPDYHLKSLPVYAIYPSRKLLPLRTRCLIDFLVDHL